VSEKQLKSLVCITVILILSSTLLPISCTPFLSYHSAEKNEEPSYDLSITNEYANMSVSQAKQMIESNFDLVILDVRTWEEYISGHIKNATLIPLDELEGRLGELDSQKPTLVYSRSGGRSITASQILVDHGFIEVYNMLGGITAWINAGYPIVHIEVPKDYATIQAAINAANEGDTIFVYPGIYYENVVVTKAVSLIGENRESTIIDSEYIGTVILVSSANYVMISDFTIRNSGLEYYAGIYLSNANHCNIAHNNILDNLVGILLYSSSSSKIVGNNLKTNSGNGISLASSSNNTIIHNNFINNTNQIYLYQSINTWDNGYPFGGNYWSDYNETDTFSGPYQNVTGSDGIGDTPYIIDENNTDCYPLMSPYPCIHALAVKDVKLGKTVLGQGFTAKIYVDIANLGHFIETFNVTVYANTTMIDKLVNVTMTSGDSATFTFLWNTTGVAYGNYTMKAIADTVPGEIYTLDNTLMDGTVLVTIPGDVNGDYTCDMKDIFQIILHFMCKVGDPCYVPNCDVNGDDIVDMKDIFTAIMHFMESL